MVMINLEIVYLSRKQKMFMYIKLTETKAFRGKQYLFMVIGHGANFALFSCSVDSSSRLDLPQTASGGKHLERCHHSLYLHFINDWLLGRHTLSGWCHLCRIRRLNHQTRRHFLCHCWLCTDHAVPHLTGTVWHLMPMCRCLVTIIYEQNSNDL